MKCVKFHSDEGSWSCPSARYIDSALDMVGCNGSTSPKVSKSEEPGDKEIVDDELAGAFRSAVLTLLYLSNERSDVQSTVCILCTRLEESTAGDIRKLKKPLRYLAEARHMGIVFNSEPVDDKVLRMFSDSDWATDTVTKKSTGGAVIMAGGCRLHVHSRGQDVVA